MVLARRSIPPRIVRATALAAFIASGCESIVGIHPSRDIAATTDPAPAAGPDEAASGREPRGDTLPTGSGDDVPSQSPERIDTVELDTPAAADPPPDISAAAVDAGPGISEDTGVVVSPVADAGGCSSRPPPDPGPVLGGTAFVFSAGPNNGGAVGLCSFPSSELPGAPRFYGAVERRLMPTAASRCGACLQARHEDTTVDVTIIDVIEPNPLAQGFTLAMDSGALRALSPTGGNLDVQFTFVPCDGAETIRVKFASSSDPSVLVIGHRTALVAARLATASGSELSLTRQEYNFWTPPTGFVSNGAPISLVLSDDQGNRLTLPNLTLSAEVVDTGLQFPSRPANCFQ